MFRGGSLISSPWGLQSIYESLLEQACAHPRIYHMAWTFFSAPHSNIFIDQKPRAQKYTYI
jgi:hypothetical protein